MVRNSGNLVCRGIGRTQRLARSKREIEDLTIVDCLLQIIVLRLGNTARVELLDPDGHNARVTLCCA